MFFLGVLVYSFGGAGEGNGCRLGKFDLQPELCDSCPVFKQCHTLAQPWEVFLFRYRQTWRRNMSSHPRTNNVWKITNVLGGSACAMQCSVPGATTPPQKGWMHNDASNQMLSDPSMRVVPLAGHQECEVGNPWAIIPILHFSPMEISVHSYLVAYQHIFLGGSTVTL